MLTQRFCMWKCWKISAFCAVPSMDGIQGFHSLYRNMTMKSKSSWRRSATTKKKRSQVRRGLLSSKSLAQPLDEQLLCLVVEGTLGRFTWWVKYDEALSSLWLPVLLELKDAEHRNSYLILLSTQALCVSQISICAYNGASQTQDQSACSCNFWQSKQFIETVQVGMNSMKIARVISSPFAKTTTSSKGLCCA